MAGVIQERHLGALNLLAEGLHGSVEACLVEVELGSTADQGEAERLQGAGHELGVIGGIGELGHVAIGPVVDDEGNARSRQGRERRQNQQAKPQKQTDRVAHRLPPAEPA